MSERNKESLARKIIRRGTAMALGAATVWGALNAAQPAAIDQDPTPVLTSGEYLSDGEATHFLQEAGENIVGTARRGNSDTRSVHTNYYAMNGELPRVDVTTTNGNLEFSVTMKATHWTEGENPMPDPKDVTDIEVAIVDATTGDVVGDVLDFFTWSTNGTQVGVGGETFYHTPAAKKHYEGSRPLSEATWESLTREAKGVIAGL